MESDWQEYPLPSMEEPNIPLYDLIDWLGNFPGHPEPLTPHHGYVMPEWIEEIVKEAADETCKDCGKKHEEGKCDLYGHETTLPDPPADLEWDGEDLDDPNAPGNYHPASYETARVLTLVLSVAISLLTMLIVDTQVSLTVTME